MYYFILFLSYWLIHLFYVTLPSYAPKLPPPPKNKQKKNLAEKQSARS